MAPHPQEQPIFSWSTNFKLEEGSLEAYWIKDNEKILKVKASRVADLTTDLRVDVESDASQSLARLYLTYSNIQAIVTEKPTRKFPSLHRYKAQGLVDSYNDRFWRLQGVFIFLPKWGFPIDLGKPREDLQLEKSASEDRIYLFYTNPSVISIKFEVNQAKFSEVSKK